MEELPEESAEEGVSDTEDDDGESPEDGGDKDSVDENDTVPHNTEDKPSNDVLEPPKPLIPYGVNNTYDAI